MARRRFQTGVIITGDGRGGERAIKLTRENLEKLNKQLEMGADLSQKQGVAAFGMSQKVDGLGDSFRSVTRLAVGFLGAVGAINLADQFRETIVETDRLRAVLRVAVGDAERANVAFGALEALSRTLPLTTGELADSYVRLRNLGLKPTEESLTSFANTAAATGKSLNQFVEAVADATTNEFERLKEFGIKARQETDEVVFTFQGAETRVGKSAQEIEKFLIGIGQVQFAGAAEEQMDTLGGRLSNLQSELQTLFITMGDLGATSAFGDAITGLTDLISSLNDALPTFLSHTEEIIDTLTILGGVVLARLVGPALNAFTIQMVTATGRMALMTGAARALSGVMALLGGPAGVIILAVTALAAFATEAATVEVSAEELGEELDRLAAKWENLTEKQREASVVNLTRRLREERDTIALLTENVESLRRSLDDDQFGREQTPGNQRRREASEAFRNQREQLALFENDLEQAKLRAADLEASIQSLGSQSSAAAGGLASLNDGVKDAGDGAESLNTELTRLRDSILKQFPTVKEYGAEINQLAALYGKNEISAAQYTAKLQELRRKWIEANPELREQVRMQEEAARALERIRTPQEAYNAQLAIYAKWRELEIVDQPELIRLRDAAAQQLEDANRKAAEESTNAWADFGNEVQDIFRETFIKAEGDLGDFLDRSVAAIKEAALRLVFDNTIGTVFAGFGAGAGTGSPSGAQAAGTVGGVGGLGNLGSLFSGGGLGSIGSALGFASLLGGQGGSQAGLGVGLGQLIQGGVPVAGAFGPTTASIFSGAGLRGIASNPASALSSLDFNQIGLGSLAGSAGNLLGEALFGSSGSGFGSTIGGLVGSFIPGLGTILGSALGGVLDSLVGSLSGDGLERFLLGVSTSPDSRVYSTSSTQAESGLRLQTIDNFGNAEARQASQALLDQLLAVDAALTGALQGAGIDVDLTGRELRGQNIPERQNIQSGFFGSAVYNGLDENQLENAADEFVVSWLNAVNDQLPERVRALTAGITGTAEEMVEALGHALRIDQLLDLDVVQRTEQALEVLGQAEKTALEQFQELADGVADMVSELDGSAESLANLSNALAAQKEIAAQLAIAYRSVGIEMDALLGDTIQSLRESVLSDEELYNLRRQEIADLNQQLQTAQSPEEIERLTRDILRLANEARGLLPDDEARAATNQEFIEFFQGVAETVNDRVDSGLSTVRETDLATNQVVEVELQNADTFSDAVQQFSDIIEQMIANGNIPAQWADFIRSTGGGSFLAGRAGAEIGGF